MTVDEAGLVDLLDAFLSKGRTRFALGYRALLWVLELTSLLPGLGVGRFSRLDVEDRERASALLDEWATAAPAERPRVSPSDAMPSSRWTSPRARF